MSSRRVPSFLAALLPLMAAVAATAQPATPPMAPASATAPAAAPTLRLRGTIEAVDANGFTFKERSGETVVLAFADNFSISEVYPVDLASVQANAYVGVASMAQPDGSMRALELTVFPEAARGTGEGSYAWDLQPGSTMTNATVAELAAAPQGRTLRLKYKDGEKTVTVPSDVPVVTFRPGDRSLLVPGARAFIAAQLRDGRPTALRATVGKNGFAPPM